MTRLFLLLIICFLYGLGFSQEKGEDLSVWIKDACHKMEGFDTIAKIDQIAGKAIVERLKGGKYREAIYITLEYIDCLKKAQETTNNPIFELRMKAFKDIVCFVPLALIESEKKIDRDLIRRCLVACTKPSEQLPKNEEEKIRWLEDVRRYVHLVSAITEPKQLLSILEGYEKVLVEMETSTKGETDTQKEEPQKDGEEGKKKKVDPLFPIKVFTVFASMAAGDLDRIVTMEGGEDKVCSSMFLMAMGLIQGLGLPRESALSLIGNEIIRKADIGQIEKVVSDAKKRFSKGKCHLSKTLASIGLMNLTNEIVDRAVAEGKLESILVIAEEAESLRMMPGSLDTRAKILNRLIEKGNEEERIERLCILGEIYIEANNPVKSIEEFSKALSIKGNDKECAVKGKLKAGLIHSDLPKQTLVDWTKDFLEITHDPREIFTLIKDIRDEDVQKRAIDVFIEGVKDLDNNKREIVQEAFIKLVDSRSGSKVADLALQGVQRLGEIKIGENQIIWSLIKAKHFAIRGDKKAVLKSMKQAFSMINPKTKEIQYPLQSFLIFLARQQQYELLKIAIQNRKVVATCAPSVLAQIGAILGDYGEKRMGLKLLKISKEMKPLTPDDWLAIADAYSKMDETELGLAAIKHVGDEKDWKARAWLVKGRLDMNAKKYREAVSAFEKSYSLDNEDVTPIFFSGLAMLLLGDPEGAENAFKRCIEKGEVSGSILGGLGYALFDQSKFEEAHQVFMDAIAEDNKSPDNYIGLALTLFKLGKIDEAIESYKSAIELEPVFAKGYTGAEKKGYVYSEVEKKVWDELIQVKKRLGR